MQKWKCLVVKVTFTGKYPRGFVEKGEGGLLEGSSWFDYSNKQGALGWEPCGQVAIVGKGFTKGFFATLKRPIE
ncbi:MAG: hypothetical protein NT162_02755 [Candidatus Woesebacteria bacterium]|nr:hypothetical protein [Candidatus Woesebacteria bacterium]